MKVAVFTVQYNIIRWSNCSIPREFRSEFRNNLFEELIKCARAEKVDLAVLPGGFYRTNFPGGIANSLKYYPPKITVLVGWDNMPGQKREAWVVAPNGKIKTKIPEAWKSSGKFDKGILNSIDDRRFRLGKKMYAAFCCGDILIDNEQNAGRKPPIFNSKAAFVLAHNSAKGRSFSPAMRKLGIPVFLSHHVRNPYNTVSFAYKGKYKKNDPRPKEIYDKYKKFKWVARIYTI